MFYFFILYWVYFIIGAFVSLRYSYARGVTNYHLFLRPLLATFTHIFLFPAVLMLCKEPNRFGGHECFFFKTTEEQEEYWGG